jgi:heme-degrading monooxygenase HmoA
MVFCKLKQPEYKDAFEAAFKEVRSSVKGTPGHIQEELLHNTDEPGTYILLGEWANREAFLTWEQSPIHMQKTAPMRPYWTMQGPRKILDITVPGQQ